ncbi:MAG: Gfo/Idh/MocA family oxidoreductase [Fimbriimonadaceae bacterium]
MNPLRVGVVGCGAISGIYFENLGRYAATEVVACADLDPERAGQAAAKHGVAWWGSTDELLARDDVELVLNLTVPKAHASINLEAIAAGKHVYVEKPLAVALEDGRKTLAAAAERGLLVGCAPDTVLGAGIQTARKLIDEGAIGQIVGCNAFMMCAGHESWHPSPEFYYEVGGGPMFDMGPYYLTALVTMLGPVKRVSGMAAATFPTRTITSQPKHGKVVPVETPTHIVGLLQFAGGAIGQITTSFDVCAHTMPCIEVYGSEGSLIVPDPNGFGGDVKLRRRGDSGWQTVPHTHGFAQNSRGLGVLDMAYAIRNRRPHRASGALAMHVLEIFHGFLESSKTGATVEISSVDGRPEAMPTDPPADALPN